MITKNDMNNKESGYANLLTNPNFREDWVKNNKSISPFKQKSILRQMFYYPNNVFPKDRKTIEHQLEFLNNTKDANVNPL